MKLIVFIMFFSNVFTVYGQSFETAHYFDSLGYDSLNLKQGFWKHDNVINMHIGRIRKGFEAWEYGYYIDNCKEGVWDVRSKDNKKLLGHRWYKRDTLVLEVQYYKKKVIGIEILKPILGNNEREYRMRVIDYIMFGKYGKVKSKHSYNSKEDDYFIVEY
jgi:hypothetical protein